MKKINHAFGELFSSHEEIHYFIVGLAIGVIIGWAVGFDFCMSR